MAELPKKFVRLFGAELGKAGLIEDPTGKIWPVELRRAKAEVYFQSGWHEFMDYFSISVGHFLIFRYEGDSQFHVSICDETACEIEYPYRHGEDVDESVSEGVSMENMDVPFQSAANARTAANRTRPSCRRHDSASKRRFEDYRC
ncbi:B3 domain-containing protein At1g49475-like [Papaver somniferum]|uniref:B3 domain-containing protein At1g49475-like n=1 Tax=Papaver somniferum TaxID=3469 RepID=UPI000E6F5A69|nr:B3 domain-containing protein At1g49475-like [Papaver somniferum]